jgi:DNA topoisomerase-1
MACALALAASRAETQRDAKAAVVEAIRSVAARLGNTPTVCKKSYIYPAVIDEFLANGVLDLVAGKVKRAVGDVPHALSAHEAQVIAFIERIVTRDENAHLTDLLAKSVRSSASRARSAPSRRPASARAR